jgi:hypothetical protein
MKEKHTETTYKVEIEVYSASAYGTSYWCYINGKKLRTWGFVSCREIAPVSCLASQFLEEINEDIDKWIMKQ